MIFHAILRQILNYWFCAIFSRELYICAIFYTFSNYAVLALKHQNFSLVLSFIMKICPFWSFKTQFRRGPNQPRVNRAQ